MAKQEYADGVVTFDNEDELRAFLAELEAKHATDEDGEADDLSDLDGVVELFDEPTAEGSKKKTDGADAGFEESKHPRGQPDNAGQFASGGGGSSRGHGEHISASKSEGFKKPTAAELYKAKKTVPLKLKHLHGAPQTPEAQKLVDGFNEKWAGKPIESTGPAMEKIADFKALQAAAKKLKPEKAAAPKESAGSSSEWAKKLETEAKKVAVQNGIAESGVSVSISTKLHNLGGVVAASADDKTGHITLYAAHLTPESYAGVLAHEICHVKYKALRDAWRKKDPAIFDKFNELYDGPGGPAFETLREEDGVTSYSTMYWTAYTNKKGGPSNAVYETLAEMARKKQETGVLPGGPKLKALYALMDEHWEKTKGKP